MGVFKAELSEEAIIFRSLAGFDVAEAPEPDVATCCEQCEKSLIAWKEANPLPNAIPTLQDNVCIAWTYTIDKVCYLKNGRLCC